MMVKSGSRSFDGFGKKMNEDHAERSNELGHRYNFFLMNNRCQLCFQRDFDAQVVQRVAKWAKRNCGSDVQLVFFSRTATIIDV